uniref:Uncharacterized protein n=1 Tax=Rhizophora mucronata TaxID=61149 RepID=A0A2P2NM09_RHIMU
MGVLSSMEWSQVTLDIDLLYNPLCTSSSQYISAILKKTSHTHQMYAM